MSLKKYFEKKYLEGTCFKTLDELMNDKTSIQVNAPRALIAVDLMGVWRGLNDMKKMVVPKHIPRAQVGRYLRTKSRKERREENES